MSFLLGTSVPYDLSDPETFEQHFDEFMVAIASKGEDAKILGK